jgi:hypothetical protein
MNPTNPTGVPATTTSAPAAKPVAWPAAAPPGTAGAVAGPESTKRRIFIDLEDHPKFARSLRSTMTSFPTEVEEVKSAAAAQFIVTDNPEAHTSLVGSPTKKLYHVVMQKQNPAKGFTALRLQGIDRMVATTLVNQIRRMPFVRQ